MATVETSGEPNFLVLPRTPLTLTDPTLLLVLNFRSKAFLIMLDDEIDPKLLAAETLEDVLETELDDSDNETSCSLITLVRVENISFMSGPLHKSCNWVLTRERDSLRC